MPRVPDERLFLGSAKTRLLNKKALKISVFIHGTILLVFVLNSVYRALFWSTSDEVAEQNKALKLSQQEQAIRVDVVDMPRYKITELAGIDPTKELGKPVVEPVAPVEKPKEDAGVLKFKDPTKDTKELSARERIKALRESLRVESRRKELADKLAKELGPTKEGGRPELAGNKISAGDSLTGAVAGMAQAYHGTLKAHLNSQWALPAWMQASKLRAVVLVRIGPDGRLVEKRFVRRSGNREFDDYVSLALQKADPFPPPPANLAGLYYSEGIAWGFPE